VERFEENIDQYRSPRYNEAQLRNEFANPFFIALGWDVFNEKGYAEAYKEVVHEAVVKVGGATKAPDYSFRIGGMRKFFVETKKPAINLSVDPLPAFQLRRYAWSAKLPLSILTDFEEFAVYDTRIKPAKNDKASLGRIINLTYRDYTDRWEEIADIFSPSAIRKGSFDKYVETTRKKKGTAEVDDAFLKDIESWRDELARNIALRNPGLSTRELNFAVQRIIDRIIFLRICEDRGIEEYGELSALLSAPASGGAGEIYPRLVALFNRADERYNSGLFHFNRERGRPQKPDTLTPTLKIDDKVPKEIIKDLYYPESPYEFSVLPADILGQVYEQFLGKVIRLTPGHRAVVEEKPEVKKAGGVYYTPTYIVDYIVEKTVGKLLEGKTPRQVSKLRILDPACGSGSFLIGAYQKLLDWHLEYYQNDGGFEKWRKELYEGPGGAYRLTTAERRRILLNNIYGVDIDPQAVEVTKLSLLLKVLEGESGETLNRQLEIFRERALPDLATNIKCGNSLIGPDFYQGKQISLLSDEERLRINAFDWDEEFSEIMGPRPAPAIGGAGFDAVIGNPPWGGDIDDLTEYFSKAYPRSTKKYKDTSKLFIDKGIEILKSDGFFSMIVPSALLFQPRYIDIRKLLMDFKINIIWNVGDKVFSSKVVAPSCVLVIEKVKPKIKSKVFILDTSQTMDNNERAVISRKKIYREIDQSLYNKTTQNTFVTFYKELKENEIFLGEILDCKDCGIKHQRVNVGMEQKGKTDLRSRLYYEGRKRNKNDHRFLIGADLKKSGWYIDYSNERYFVGNYKEVLRENEIVYFNEDIFNLPEKIVWRQTSDRIIAVIIGKYWFANTLQAGILKDNNYSLKYILGLINSHYLNYIYLETVKEGGRVFPQVKLSKVKALPFRTIDFDDPEDVKRHDKMVALVEDMLSLHKKLASARTDHPAEAGQRQITATDRQIDNLVYELYGLTEEEIRVVEGG